MPAVEDVDVPAVRVGEIDREAGPDGADQQRRVGAGGRRRPERERQEEQQEGRLICRGGWPQPTVAVN